MTADSAASGPTDTPASGPELRMEELYRILVETVRDYAIFVLDPDGLISSWNRGAERIKGYTEDEILGQHYRILYPPDARERGQPDKQLEIAARTGRFEGEGWRQRKDGTQFWGQTVLTALYDQGGGLVGFGKVTRDLTAERRAQAELEQRERQLAEAQQIAHLGSWEWQIGSDTIAWSEELYRIFGLEPDSEVQADRYLELVHPDDRDLVREWIAGAIEREEESPQEHRLIRSDGELRWVQARAEPVRDADGSVVRLHGTALDITDLKQAEAQARRLVAEQSARTEAERAAQRMAFLADASALLSASLEYEETLRTLASLAVPTFADWCAVDMVDPDGSIQRVAVAHVDPDRVALAEEVHRRFPPNPDAPVGAPHVIRTGEPELYEEIDPEMLEQAAEDEEQLDLLRRLDLRSAIMVPVRVGDRSLGAMTFVNAESGRQYSREDLVVAMELGGRAALAIENAHLHSAEREARKRAEEANERTARLQAITAGLSEAVTPEAVAAVMVDQGVAATQATTGTLVLTIGEDSEQLRIVRSVGLPDDVVSSFSTFSVNTGIPLAEAIRTGELVLVPNMAERDRRFPKLRDIRDRLGTRATAAVPLRSADRIIGVLGFGYSEDREFTAEEQAFLQALGRQCAQALERAWLYETEHLARETAEAASRAKSEFVAMMSHELRTPLSAILGYQELLSEGIVGPVSEKQKEQLDRIRASATHLRDLINQILSLSRIEARKEEIFPEELDLTELVQDIALLMEREVEANELHLTLDVPPDAVELETDPGKVRQILLNLISNAIKFTDDGGIHITMSRRDEGVEIRVRDTGPGIAEADRERVFDAFTQLDQSMTRRIGGSGLGLPVSRHLARLLGGSLDLDSEPGYGSTFILQLPMAPPAVPPDEEDDPDQRGDE